MQRKRIINTADVLATLPREAYETFLCPKSIARLSVCSSSFYFKHKNKPKDKNYWKNAILYSISFNTRIDVAVLRATLDSGVITNYEALYQGLMRAMPHVFYFRVSTLAGFICLGGDPNDLANGFKNNLISDNTDPQYRGGLTYLAAMGGNFKGVKYLTFNRDVQFRDYLGNTLLHEAVSWNNLEMARFFCLQKNISIEVRNGNGQTPLHIAAEHGCFAMTKLLVNECKANINAKENNNRTPLHRAIQSGHVPTARFLAEECKASLTEKDENKLTVLHFAVWSKSLEMVKYVVSMCPNLINSKNNEYGKAPAAYATDIKDYEVARFLILEAKASIESTDKEKNTLLHSTALNNNVKLTALLIQCKANIFAKNKYGRRPVDCTYINSRRKLLQIFFSAGFKPDKQALDYAKETRAWRAPIEIQKMYDEYLEESKPVKEIREESAYHESSSVCAIL